MWLVGEKRNGERFYWGSLKERGHLEDQGKNMITWDLRCSHQSHWRLKSSSVWHCVTWRVVPRIWKDHCTFICDLLKHHELQYSPKVHHHIPEDLNLNRWLFMSLHKKQGKRSKLAVDGGRTRQFLNLGDCRILWRKILLFYIRFCMLQS